MAFVTPIVAQGDLVRYMTTNDEGRSVPSTVYYVSDDTGSPVVTLFTKEGYTLYDKVKDVSEQNHSGLRGDLRRLSQYISFSQGSSLTKGGIASHAKSGRHCR